MTSSDEPPRVVTMQNTPFSGGVSSALHGGSGGGTFDRMEARVQRLEEDMKELKADMKALRLDAAEIKGGVKNLPTTVQLLGFIVAVMALAGLGKHFGL